MKPGPHAADVSLQVELVMATEFGVEEADSARSSLPVFQCVIYPCQS